MLIVFINVSKFHYHDKILLNKTADLKSYFSNYFYKTFIYKTASWKLRSI